MDVIIQKNILYVSLKLLLQLFLAVTVFFVFVPLIPDMPTGDNPIDAAWVFGMNQAISQGLEFGRELIFNFGPYISIYTRNFHPGIVHL